MKLVLSSEGGDRLCSGQHFLTEHTHPHSQTPGTCPVYNPDSHWELCAASHPRWRVCLPEGVGSALETSCCRVSSQWRCLLPGYRPAWDSSPQVQGPPLFSIRQWERCHQRTAFSGVTRHTIKTCVCDSLSEMLREVTTGRKYNKRQQTSLADKKDGQNYLKGYTVSLSENQCKVFWSVLLFLRTGTHHWRVPVCLPGRLWTLYYWSLRAGVFMCSCWVCTLYIHAILCE